LGSAGWDHLLPAWFTRLHPTRRTPINSALLVAALTLTLALALAGIAGAGRQEAFQLLQNASAIFYGVTPILGRAAPSVSLLLAAASGFAMTLLCVVHIPNYHRAEPPDIYSQGERHSNRIHWSSGVDLLVSNTPIPTHDRPARQPSGGVMATPSGNNPT